MRMWMVNPRRMCRQHLLGEHVEIHMLVGSINRGISIKGFLDGELVEPQNVRRRHDQLALEMQRRGYNHKSPLKQTLFEHRGRVDRLVSAAELVRRCAACAAMWTES